MHFLVNQVYFLFFIASSDDKVSSTVCSTKQDTAKFLYL